MAELDPGMMEVLDRNDSKPTIIVGASEQRTIFPDAGKKAGNGIIVRTPARRDR
jgi:hypothetical protein